MTNDKDSAVLEPCPVPWCGSPDAKALSFDANRRRHWIECGKCNFKTPQMPSRAKVITLWNTRQPTQSDALREALGSVIALLDAPAEPPNGVVSVKDYARWANARIGLGLVMIAPRLRAALQEQSK